MEKNQPLTKRRRLPICQSEDESTSERKEYNLRSNKKVLSVKTGGSRKRKESTRVLEKRRGEDHDDDKEEEVEKEEDEHPIMMEEEMNDEEEKEDEEEDEDHDDDEGMMMMDDDSGDIEPHNDNQKVIADLLKRVTELEKQVQEIQTSLGSKRKHGEEKSPSIILRNEAICDLYGVDRSDPDLLKMELTPLIQYVVKEIVVRKGESSTPLLEYYQALSKADEVAFSSKKTSGVSKSRKKKNEVSLEDMEKTRLIMSLINYCIQTGIGKDQESADKAPLLILYDSVKFKYDWTLDIDGYGKLIISWQSFGVISSPKTQPLNLEEVAEGAHHRFIQISRILDYPIVIPSNEMTMKYELGGLYSGQQEVLRLIAKMLSILEPFDKIVSVKYMATPGHPILRQPQPQHSDAAVIPAAAAAALDHSVSDSSSGSSNVVISSIVEVYPVNQDEFDELDKMKNCVNTMISRVKISSNEMKQAGKFKVLLRLLQYTQYTNCVFSDTRNVVVDGGNKLVANRDMEVGNVITSIPYTKATNLFGSSSLPSSSTSGLTNHDNNQSQFRRLFFGIGDEVMVSLCSFLPTEGFGGLTSNNEKKKQSSPPPPSSSSSSKNKKGKGKKKQDKAQEDDAARLELSLTPNCRFRLENDKALLICLRDLKKGEEIIVSDEGLLHLPEHNPSDLVLVEKPSHIVSILNNLFN